MKLLLEGETTTRLQFRTLKPSDFDTWLPFHEEPLSTQYWEGLPKDPYTACKQQFDKTFERYANTLGGMNALIALETKQLIGLAGLLVQTVNGVQELEIGYSILPQYWKQGYATEAAKKCKTYAFEQELASSLISIIHINNIPSQKVALNNEMFLDLSLIHI